MTIASAALLLFFILDPLGNIPVILSLFKGIPATRQRRILARELVIALVVRTRHVFFNSRPGKLLLISTLVFISITLVLPYLPFIKIFGFIPLPAPFMLAMIGLTALYVLATEITKKFFYSRITNANA